MLRRIGFLSLIVAMILTSCAYSQSPATASHVDQPNPVKGQAGINVAESNEPEPTEVIPATATPTEEPTEAPEVKAPVLPTVVGPDKYPTGTNPLTGLPVSHPENLLLPPALVSVTNFPVSARPQAGLSFSPIVFEIYIGEGMSRFLAMFYGDFPSEAVTSNQSISEANTSTASSDAEIGPIRSGRLPYESMRKLYNGFLVMASAYKGVAANLSQYSNVFGNDRDINAAMIKVTDLDQIAKANEKQLGEQALNGMKFDPQIEGGGGKPAQSVYLLWSMLNQLFWRYDAASGAYTRWQDNADGKTFIQATDRLTGEPLAFENVVFLFANHRACTDTAFDVDLMGVPKGKAVIFRDGKMFEAAWTTQGGQYEATTGKLRPIRFLDVQGNPFAFKPGQTWIEVLPTGTPYWETINSTTMFDLLNKKEPGSGNWAFRFFASSMVNDPRVCQQIRGK